MKINHNMSAMIANNQLLRNENTLSDAVERLSSGLKINHASDDAAGMAIASKMRAQIKGLNQASRNASDGISVLETADGAMNEVTAMLQRMRELSVQAANEIYIQEDLEAIQLEIDSLTAEIDRVSTDTEFNTKKLLDGSLDQRVYLNTRSVERVSISDTVAAKDYKINVVQDARQAVLKGGKPIGGATVPDGATGKVTINGVEVKIEKGEEIQDVYQKLRDAAEIGEVNLIAVSDTTPGGGKVENAGYEDVPCNAYPSPTFVFVSDRYGSAAEIKITCDNEDLADYLGISTKASTHGTDAKLNVDGTRAAAKGDNTIDPDATVPAGTGSDVQGVTITVGVDKFPVIFSAGESVQDAYQKIQNRLEARDINVHLVATSDFAKDENGKYIDAGTVAGNYLAFQAENTGTEENFSISFSSPEIAELFGFAQQNPELEPGTDPALGEGFTSQATYTSDGRDVVITDRNGFKMSFRVQSDMAGSTFEDPTMEVGKDAEKILEGTVANGDGADVDFEVTEIGTMTLQIGANENQTMEVRIPSISAKMLYIDEVDVCTVTGADRAISTYDKAIAMVSESRSRLGAYQNRLEYAVNSLDATEENMTAALSRIEDADMAEEMTTYTQYNVLSQAATSVLAQANDIPQQALQLLQ